MNFDIKKELQNMFLVENTSVDSNEVKEFTENQEITIIGTANDYKQKDDTNPNTLYINDCFAE